MSDEPARRGWWARLAVLAGRAALGLGFLWALGALHYMVGGGAAGKAFVALYAVGTAVFLVRLRSRAWMWIAGGCLVGMSWFLTTEARDDRDWMPELARAPTADIDGDRVTVHGVRNCLYRSETDFDVRYEDRTYDLSRIEGGDLIVSYWDGNTAIAHTMLSFRFSDRPPLCLSFEIRREKGEDWGGLPGIYKQFELLYVLADERDLVNLRTSYRGEEVYLYRLRVTPDDARAYLLHLLETCNRVAARPEFYDTLEHNCTSALTLLGKDLWPHRPRIAGLRSLMNGYIDEQLHSLGRMASDLPFPELRGRSRITDVGREHKDDPDFSRAIRKNLP